MKENYEEKKNPFLPLFERAFTRKERKNNYLGLISLALYFNLKVFFILFFIL